MTLNSDKTTIARLAAIARKLEETAGSTPDRGLERDFSVEAQLKRIETALLAGALESLSLGALLDVTLTSPASGDLLEYDGTEWVNSTPAPDPPLKRYLSFSVNAPDSIQDHAERATKSFCVWLNLSSYDFKITKVTAIADTDDYTSTLYISSSTGDISSANQTTVTSLACSTDGTDGYYAEVTSFTDDTIVPGQWLIWEHTSGSAGNVSVTIEGYFDD